MNIIIAVGATVAVLLAVGAILFPRAPREQSVTDLAWRDYELSKRQGCKL